MLFHDVDLRPIPLSVAKMLNTFTGIVFSSR